MDTGLLSFFAMDETPGAPEAVLQELTVNPSTVAPEQVLLLLHSQLSSDMLVLLQGLQERGL